ncbi:MAG: hypothetical protein L3J41_02945 [Melioribacteraceae bacterium]|nr:hypothetical protein [Melioribacteraceae bacterium]
MNTQEKALARILFENKLFRSDGQSFEDLFTEIMSLSELNFRKIKAWGNIGDRKNDGYISDKGIYFQVFAPEDIRKSYPNVIKKIKTDFAKLLDQWKPVNEFYFVVNDKFNGVNADSEKTLKSLTDKYKLQKSGFLTSDDLARKVFSLDEDQILKIVSCLPNVENVENVVNLDYSTLKEVIGFIMKMPLSPEEGEIKFPDWDKKIEFNKLSSYSAHLLNNGSTKLGNLNKYLANQSFLAEELQRQLIGIYEKIKTEWSNLDYVGENIFWEIVNECSPKHENTYQSAVITILSKYFESCDIFEEPTKE